MQALNLMFVPIKKLSSPPLQATDLSKGMNTEVPLLDNKRHFSYIRVIIKRVLINIPYKISHSLL